jgi:hypothetical protein
MGLLQDFLSMNWIIFEDPGYIYSGSGSDEAKQFRIQINNTGPKYQILFFWGGGGGGNMGPVRVSYLSF